MSDTDEPITAVGLSAVGEATIVELMPIKLKRALDEACSFVSARKLDGYVDLSDPRTIEMLTCMALRELGYNFVDDLTLARRPPAGCMSRKRRLEWMRYSSDSVLQYASKYLIPVTRKARNKGKRSTTNRIPQQELAKLVRLVRERRIRDGASDSFRSSANEVVEILGAIGLDYDVEHVRDAWRAEFHKLNRN